MTWLGAAGDVISTSGDLNRFQRALAGGRLLPQLTFDINGDWLSDPSLYVNVIEAEFCGRTPSRTDRPSALPRLG
jgi:D-alanyl-D-alanine carboxypeptidase